MKDSSDLLIDHHPADTDATFEVLPQLPMPSGIDHREKPITVSLFEGSPAYKQRKKKGVRDSTLKQFQSRERGHQHHGAADADANDDCDPSDEENSMKGSPPAKKDQGSPRTSLFCTTSTPPDAAERDDVEAQSRIPGPSATAAQNMEAVYVTRPYLDQSSSGSFAGDGDSANTALHGNNNLGTIASAVPEEKASAARIQASWHMPYLPGPPVPMTTAYRSTASINRPPAMGVLALGAKRSFLQSTQDSEYAQDIASSSSDNGGVSASGRMFQCPLDTCGRLFKRLEHLKRHVRTHTQERPYACTQCGKRFSRSDNLTQHIKIHDKINRNERGKTEYAEDEDLVKVLEARVEAMRGHPLSEAHHALPFYHGSGYTTDIPLYTSSRSHMERGYYLAHMHSTLPPSLAPAGTTFYQHMPHAPTYHPILGNEMESSNSVHPYLLASNSQPRLPDTTLHSRPRTRSPPAPPASYRVNATAAKAATATDVLGVAQRLGRPKAATAFDNRYSPYLVNRPAITEGVSTQGQLSNQSVMHVDIHPGAMLRFMNQSEFLPVQKQFICDPVATSTSKLAAAEEDGMRSDHDIMQTTSLHSVAQTVHQPSRPDLVPNADTTEDPLADAQVSVNPVAHQQHFQHSGSTTQESTTSTFPVVTPANPPVSSDTLSFRGMLVTASYEPDSAMWPLNAVSPSEHRYFEPQPSPARNPHRAHPGPREN